MSPDMFWIGVAWWSHATPLTWPPCPWFWAYPPLQRGKIKRCCGNNQLNSNQNDRSCHKSNFQHLGISGERSVVFFAPKCQNVLLRVTRERQKTGPIKPQIRRVVPVVGWLNRLVWYLVDICWYQWKNGIFTLENDRKLWFMVDKTNYIMGFIYQLYSEIPSGDLLHSYWTGIIYSGFTHWTWWIFP